MPIIGRLREIPYRGDGRSNAPRRFPLSESQKSSMRGLGCMVIATGILLVYLIFTAHNGFIGFVSITGILFLLIVFFAMRDAQGIKTITPPNDAHPIDKKDPAMLDDYIAQIEWKQAYHRNHPEEPKWRFRPTLAKGKTKDFGFFIVLPATIPVFVLAYFFGINSPVSIIGTLIYGLVGIFTYLIYQDTSH